VTGGGDVTGSGVIDVGVVASTYSAAGGGRAAVVGYGSIADAIVENVVMDGANYYKSGAGSFYHRGVDQLYGTVVVRSSFIATYNTPLDNISNVLHAIEVDKANVVAVAHNTSEDFKLTTLAMSAGSSLSLNSGLVLSNDYDLIVAGKLVINGNLATVRTLSVTDELSVRGTLTVVEDLSVGRIGE
jgi:hypothetical protein